MVVESIVGNWFFIVVGAAVIGAAIFIAHKFFKQPLATQIEAVKQWLLWAVTQAEAELGTGTGQLKLVMVYDMFAEKFPKLTRVISYATFKTLVDEALENMRNLLNTNDAVAELIYNTTTK